MEDIMYVECPDCEGEGKLISVGYGCITPASECCGGCNFDAGECETCNGTGLILNEEE